MGLLTDKKLISASRKLSLPCIRSIHDSHTHRYLRLAFDTFSRVRWRNLFAKYEIWDFHSDEDIDIGILSCNALKMEAVHSPKLLYLPASSYAITTSKINLDTALAKFRRSKFNPCHQTLVSEISAFVLDSIYKGCLHRSRRDKVLPCGFH
jgi:hypothetical protein